MWVASSEALPSPTFRAEWATPRGNEEGLTRVQRDGLSAFKLVLQRALEDIGNFLAGMAMTGRRCAGGDIDTHLDGLVAG